jgi:hypothetical protein
MLSCSSSDNKALPKEFRPTAEALFPAGAQNSGQFCLQNYLDFADKLGVGKNYRKVEEGWNNADQLDRFLHSFRNNLELLIQKTWVEKADEDRKEKLLGRVPNFIAVIKAEKYDKALGEFGSILEELAWLLFGAQSHKDDFFDYVFRIDPQIGLFWWYGGQLEQFIASGPKDPETQKDTLLLGLCYITDF